MGAGLQGVFANVMEGECPFLWSSRTSKFTKRLKGVSRELQGEFAKVI